MTDDQRPATTTDSGIPAPSDEFSLTVGPSGPDRPARPLRRAEDAALQPRARARARRARQGRRRARVLRGHRGRHAVHEGRLPRRGRQAHRRCSLASRPWPASRASPTPCATRAASRSSSTPTRATSTWSATTRRSSSCATRRSSRTSSTRRSGCPTPGMRYNEMQWDFWTLSPESAHQVTILMSDRGIPAHAGATCTASRSHTYSWVNAGGERFWVKYHFKTAQGIENLTEAEADADGRRGPRLPPPRPVRLDRAAATRPSGASRCRSCRSRTRPTTASTRST